jgi:hypothetical protein
MDSCQSRWYFAAGNGDLKVRPPGTIASATVGEVWKAKGSVGEPTVSALLCLTLSDFDGQCTISLTNTLS